MGVLYSIGRTLVSRDELAEKSAIGHLGDFMDSFSSGRTASLLFRSGAVSTRDLSERPTGAMPFEPVGMNKPLTLEIVSAYTGDAPDRSFLDKIVGRSKPDMLIVSGSKTPSTFGATPRAINQVVKDIDDKNAYKPAAFRDGSPVIYHSPAVTDATTYVSVEMVVDSFSGDIFTHMTSLFQAAAGLPVFAPAAAYLLAGACISKIGKKLAEALCETGPFLKADEDIRLESAGFPIELARFMVFAPDAGLPKLAGYGPRVVTKMGNDYVRLVNLQSGDEYKGDVPYLIASLDGRPRPEYKEFKPQHASAAMLQQFYGRDTLGSVAETLKEAMTLYNDLHFRRAADRLKTELKTAADKTKELQEQLRGVPEGAAEHKMLLEQIDVAAEALKKIEARMAAYNANIQTDEFRIVP